MIDSKRQEKKQKKIDSKAKWIIEVFIITFISSIFFSYVSTNGVSKLDVIPAILILILVIFTGILFDIIGVAVTVANEEEFHAKATKKAVRSKDIIKTDKKFCTSCKCLCRCNRRYLPEYSVEQLVR